MLTHLQEARSLTFFISGTQGGLRDENGASKMFLNME